MVSIIAWSQKNKPRWGQIPSAALLYTIPPGIVKNEETVILKP
jgi:hypothetical protein